MAADREEHHQKWLVLAYLFNIDGKAASQTITDRIPFLLRKQIDIRVLSGPTGEKDHRFPHHRIFSCAPSGLQYELRYLLKQKNRTKVSVKIAKALVSIFFLPLYLIERTFIHLDTHWSWGISAATSGLWHTLASPPDLIYSTAGPAATHFGAYILHKMTGIPWLAELHDPLIYDNDNRRWHQRFIFKNWLEKVICTNASGVIYFTRHALDSANRRHQIINHKYVIRPGAAPPKMGTARYRKRAKMHIGHFGALAVGRNLVQVMKALQILISKQPELGDKIILDLYGPGLDSHSTKSLEKFPFPEIVKLHGLIHRKEALAAMTECDVLLLLHGSGVICDEYIPSKVYEYLQTGRPILTLTSAESELADIIREHGQMVADPDNAESIKDAINSLASQWIKDKIPSPDLPCRYTVEHTANKLIGITAEIVKKKHDG